jgi:hypothetical protein
MAKAQLPLLLWLSLIGATVSKPPEQEWFAGHLAKLVASSSSSFCAGVLSTRLVLGSVADKRVGKRDWGGNTRN